LALGAEGHRFEPYCSDKDMECGLMARRLLLAQ
jgi:hypothetical protein